MSSDSLALVAARSACQAAEELLQVLRAREELLLELRARGNHRDEVRARKEVRAAANRVRDGLGEPEGCEFTINYRGTYNRLAYALATIDGGMYEEGTDLLTRVLPELRVLAAITDDRTAPPAGT
ncbi:MAG: hypothetical protein ACRDT6_18675 [Micromonosporaceae bacterium]